MIIPLEKAEYASEEYVVCPRAASAVAELRVRMLRRAKVTEGSYAHGLVTDLHAAIFVHSIDLKADYETYFAVEYSTFVDYLVQYARFSVQVAEAISGASTESGGAFHFRPGYAFLREREYGLPLLTSLIEEVGS